VSSREGGTVVLKVLIAYDGSAEADRALDWATRLPESVATVIGVVPTLAGSEPIADAVDPTVEPDAFMAELRAAAEKLAAAGVAATAVEKAGNPAEVIIETAEEGAFDLIVIGTRGRHAVERFLFGATAERVARHATTPVLLVR
jgi:nucleotide-binding universal stress UspA family protein